MTYDLCTVNSTHLTGTHICQLKLVLVHDTFQTTIKHIHSSTHCALHNHTLNHTPYINSLSLSLSHTLSLSLLTEASRDPSFLHANAVMVYMLGMCLGVASSHSSLRGAQLYTLNLQHKTASSMSRNVYNVLYLS